MREGKKTLIFVSILAFIYFAGLIGFMIFIMSMTENDGSNETFLKMFLVLTAFIVVGNASLTLVLRFSAYRPIQTDDSRYSFYASRLEKCGFLASYDWNGASTDIVIPDEINGYKVTSLGGGTNKRPQKFHIKISPQSLGCDKLVDETEYEKKHNESDEYSLLTFNIKIGKNLTRLGNIMSSYKNAFLVREREMSDGKKEYDFVYKIVYRFEVDEANEGLYSKDGRLYNKKNDNPIMEFNYE